MSERKMTPQEAIIVLDRLNTSERIDIDRDELRAAVKVAKTALMKQIPVKTLPPDIIMGRFNPTDFKCPTCKNTFPEEYETPFCGQCGQALDWGEI